MTMPEKKLKVALVCSHGGHFTEMREIEEAFKDHEVFFVSYRAVSTKDLPKALLIDNIGNNPLRMVVGALGIFFRFVMDRPDIVFSTGAEIAIPACYIGKLLGARIGHMECSAQVVTPSFTGRLVYPVADLFLVQWERLLQEYGSKARYVGGLI